MSSERTRRRYLRLLAAGSVGTLAGCSSFSMPGRDERKNVDDWRTEDVADLTDTPTPTETPGAGEDPTATPEPGTTRDPTATPISTPQVTPTPTSIPVSTSTAVAYDAAGGATGGSGSVGLATGGAKGIATFRRNVEEGYLPLPESLATEGLYYDYYFDTGQQEACSSLFCPSYSPAVTADPLSDETERYLTVGLNSGLDADSFDRKALNLVVVLDVSGSMGSEFDDYYYDQFGNRQTPEGETDVQKMAVARQALVALTNQLRPEDRFGLVLFNESATTAKPLRSVETTDMDAIRTHIQEEITAGGSTNLAAGMQTGMDMLSEYEDADKTTYENRVLFLTDAMPNTGETGDTALQTELEANAANGLYTTFVGIGVDFNAELVDELTAVRGANYYGVHSADEFEAKLSDEFKYMVTPLVFDLELDLDAPGYEIEKVYGSTAAEEATGRLMYVNTLFASPTQDGKTKGGVVLVKVNQTGADGEMTLTASWQDRTGQSDQTTSSITFPTAEPEHFANTGIQKAVLLARYTDLLKNWMIYERDATLIQETDGIEIPPPEEELGEWEQQSEPLTVTSPYETRISQFREYFATEATAVGDTDLDQELEIMDTILSHA